MNKFFNKGFHSICVKDPLIDGLSSHVPPIYATSTFAYENLETAFDFFKSGGKTEGVYTYSRLGNPSVRFVGEKIAALEAYGIEGANYFGMLFSSGMAAISAAIMANVKAGDKIITQGNLYGTTNELMVSLLKDFGVETIYADLKDLNFVEDAIINDEKIKLLYIETPANPTLDCYDLDGLAAIAQNQGIITIVDNTFATPYVQQPLKYGIDFVVHSSTKFLNGHGTATSGVVVGKNEEAIYKKVYGIQKMVGAVCSPFDAYLLNNGIKTLPLRMEQHQKNAMELALFLEQHIAVKKVNYLGLNNHENHQLAKDQMRGFSGMLSFELKGGMQAGMDFMRGIQFCTLTATLGTADTLVTHSASTSHVNVPQEQRLQYGITDGLIRVSVGLENIEDIIADFEMALNGIKI
ncbi:MAG TPA: aminotransferase class I/II-fold pyridoxal phosphate-dependent enzyme [Chitinophagales bacterium]|jgi:methionine-gamma-lyase|nr:aminotransferase class I/II-fold pyridoxal phosphate-dependent enzyme [Chitinophagales bacterium]HQW79322.1 aminotransferase class I/II-fold pyridoxal phosphate-dependent enzyme [Chitinophagales bacterium]HRB67230.1 aminotransferase class I/II-fold pyridoxal phosphate-dependent enzyme [Chitinophagales bacterium]HRB92262.1 aminotransferase class I/II-fold pyridoxal phosphate-dependent enzyme [Chitinophagales bacterium]